MYFHLFVFFFPLFLSLSKKSVHFFPPFSFHQLQKSIRKTCTVHFNSIATDSNSGVKYEDIAVPPPTRQPMGLSGEGGRDLLARK